MKRTHLITLQIVLLATGAFATKRLSSAMFDDGQLQPQPNVLHLKQSPFGRTLALAMRGPVDVYWHRGEIHDHAHEDGEHANCPDCAEAHDHTHGPECAHGAECAHGHGEHDHAGAPGPLCEHGPECEQGHGPECAHGHEHAHGPECDHCEHHAGEKSVADLAADIERLMDGTAAGEETPASGGSASGQADGLRQALLGRIGEMRRTYYSRTNTHADTRMHKAFIMGEVQKRLRLSYEMDPSNVACYGAYFLFLSEAIARVEEENADAGVVRHRREAALQLAHFTIAYCLKLPEEAPAMITGAVAAHDYLQIYLEQPEADLELAGKFFDILQHCVARYELVRERMIDDGRWEKLSIHRINEMEGAHSLICKVLELNPERFSRLKRAAAPADESPQT